MEIKNLFQKKSMLFIVCIFIALVCSATLFPILFTAFTEVVIYPVLAFAFGVNLVLVVIGSFILGYFLIKQWIICVDFSNKLLEKEAENEHNENMQKLLNADADNRRIHELENSKKNDLFRLIELAKDKPEENTEKTEIDEMQAKPKHTLINKTITKNEGLNLDKFASILKQYEILTIHQQTNQN